MQNIHLNQTTETLSHSCIDRLKEWLEKQSDKEKEREQRRQERLARRRAMPNHKFDDPVYDQQRTQLAESQEQALSEGIMELNAGSEMILYMFPLKPLLRPLRVLIWFISTTQISKFNYSTLEIFK